MDKAIKMVAFFAHVSFVEEPISFHLISRAICKRIYQAIDDGIYLWSPSFFFLLYIFNGLELILPYLIKIH